MYFFTTSTLRKSQLKHIAYYPKCIMMKFHRKKFVDATRIYGHFFSYEEVQKWMDRKTPRSIVAEFCCQRDGKL